MSSNGPTKRFLAMRTTGEDGRPRTVFPIRCDCGTSDVFNGSVGGHNGSVDEFLIRAFRKRGWLITHKTMRCPDCASRGAKLKQAVPPGFLKPQPETETMARSTIDNRNLEGLAHAQRLETPPSGGSGRKPADPAVVHVAGMGKVLDLMSGQTKPEDVEKAIAELGAAKAPPEITTDGRRRIFREIDDHWQEGSRCYEPEWSDRRIATALDVPRAWVALVRADSFGGPDNNQQVAEIIQALGDKIKMTATFANQAMGLASDFEKMQGDFAELLKRVEALK